jgi:hypothetical protein
MTTSAAIALQSGKEIGQEMQKIEPNRNSSCEKTKTVLKIIGIALAAIALVAGIAALTILFPHVMVPVLALTIGLPVTVLGIFALAFARFGH